MEAQDIINLVNSSKEYFNSQATKSYEFRLNALKTLKASLLENKDALIEAFKRDLNKCEFDVYTCEFVPVLTEINYLIKHLKKLMKPEAHGAGLFNIPGKGRLVKEPFGVVLVIAPWNYPLQLSFVPIAGAIAAGNTVVFKPSSATPNISDVLKDILSVFDTKYICPVMGGRNEIGALLDQKFDYIFFTGGATVGHLIMEKASVHLTPITLELGGKSPTIICKDADIKLAAKRIAWGKYLNAGQTCVAPDYMLVHSSVHDDFVKEVIKNIKQFYYQDNKISDNFTHIVNERQRDRILSLIDESKVVYKGENDGLLISPIIMDNVTFEDKIMSEEIFGPVMPIIKFDDLDEVLATLIDKPKPLALYVFTQDTKTANKVMDTIPSGGVCVNEVIMHVVAGELPFGGVGNSGMGQYHGDKTFLTFTHEKTVIYKKKCELELKYPPYNKKKLNFVKKLFKIK